MQTFNTDMKLLYQILLFHASLQLQCDKREITAHVGGEFVLFCKYDTRQFLYNRKYWCRGGSRDTCVILVDSEHLDRTGGSCQVVDAGRRGLFVKAKGLRLNDAGAHWVGIDKIYSDVMIFVNVVVTEVPVSKPVLWPLSPLEDGPTCRGQPVTVRCGCASGTGVRYAWYRRTPRENSPLCLSADLGLHCAAVEMGGDYYCVASNDVSSRGSDALSVRVLVPADSGCVYVVDMQGQPMYDCMDGMSTTGTPPLSTCQADEKGNQSHPSLFLKRTWEGRLLWYSLLCWGCFASLLMSLCIVLKCAKTRHRNHGQRQRRARHKPVAHRPR